MLILLIVLACLLFIVLMLFLLYWLWRQRKQARTGDLQGLFVERSISAEDLEGKWFEIARIDSSFEPHNMTNVTAEYRHANGIIHVQNRGQIQKSCKIANGTAWKTPTSGVLQVSFFPFVSGAYVVLDAFRNEQNQVTQVVVGSPSRKYLWLLSRDLLLESSKRSAIEHTWTVASKNQYTNIEKRLHIIEQTGHQCS